MDGGEVISFIGEGAGEINSRRQLAPRSYGDDKNAASWRRRV